MPDIPVGNQLFDLAFHPSSDAVYVATVAGEVKCFKYDGEGNGEQKFAERVTKRSMRGLEFDAQGGVLFCVGKDKCIHSLNPETGKVKEVRKEAHENPINRIKNLTEQMFVTGDDDGIIKLWDPRKQEAVRTFKYHLDFISDFCYLPSKKHLISTSGDATLSVVDIRSNKDKPLAQSEDQEDELLSIVAIKRNSRFVVGTQLGTLTVFKPSKGWGDCVDRIPGHPASVDALVPLPGTENVILTGSSDGMIRALQVYPNKLLGVIGDHGEFPIERMKVSRDGRWLGSASHDESLKLTDIKDCLEESDDDGGEKSREEKEEKEGSDDSDVDTSSKEEPEQDSSEEEDIVTEKKRKKKRTHDPLGIKKKKENLRGTGDPSFFADL